MSFSASHRNGKFDYFYLIIFLIFKKLLQYLFFFFFKDNFFFLKQIFILNYLFIYLLAVLGLRFCARALSSCGEWGPPSIAVRGPLTIAAPPAAEHRPQTRRPSSRGPRAQPLRGMWDPPRPGLEPVSPASAGRLPTTAPPGKPCSTFIQKNKKHKCSRLNMFV